MRLLLAPHAPTQWNAERRYQGHVDTPLSDVGRRQAALLARRLAEEPIDEIHVSDLRRAVETAEAVAAQIPLALRVDPRLRELAFGAWEGLTFEEVCQKFPEMTPSSETNVPRIPPPGGETLIQLADRIGSFFAEVKRELSPKRTLLVVAHRGALQVFLSLALGLPPDAWWKFRLEPASLSEINVYSDGTVLHRFNETHHLRETAYAR
jgi:broad specificity phosphatase PhoE